MTEQVTSWNEWKDPCGCTGWTDVQGWHTKRCDQHHSEMLARRARPRPGDQPLPTVNDSADIQSAVIADMVARRTVGIERYGTALQPHNGRDALRDLYEELLDAVMYTKQLMVERDGR